jgi:hypothetical protein
MELNSGAKMADGKYRKTYVAGSVDRENTVLASICLELRYNKMAHIAHVCTNSHLPRSNGLSTPSTQC